MVCSMAKASAVVLCQICTWQQHITAAAKRVKHYYRVNFSAMSKLHMAVALQPLCVVASIVQAFAAVLCHIYAWQSCIEAAAHLQALWSSSMLLGRACKKIVIHCR